MTARNRAKAHPRFLTVLQKLDENRFGGGPCSRTRMRGLAEATSSSSARSSSFRSDLLGDIESTMSDAEVRTAS